MAKNTSAAKFVYFFGGGEADGNESMKNLLGGKGANLAEMAGHPKLRLPVPPGFTITTDVCTWYYKNDKTYPAPLQKQVEEALHRIEKLTGKSFGDAINPLLVSVRSGARKSMPGMMETILNVGLNEETIKGLIAHSGDERFAYDAYRRLIMMYADVVMEKAAGIEPKHGKGIRKLLDEKLEKVKQTKGYNSDTDLTVTDLKALVKEYKTTVLRVLGNEFPEDPYEQLRVANAEFTLKPGAAKPHNDSDPQGRTWFIGNNVRVLYRGAAGFLIRRTGVPDEYRSDLHEVVERFISASS